MNDYHISPLKPEEIGSLSKDAAQRLCAELDPIYAKLLQEMIPVMAKYGEARAELGNLKLVLQIITERSRNLKNIIREG